MIKYNTHSARSSEDVWVIRIVIAFTRDLDLAKFVFPIQLSFTLPLWYSGKEKYGQTITQRRNLYLDIMAIMSCIVTLNSRRLVNTASSTATYALRLRTTAYTYVSCTTAARGLRGMREWRRYIDHEGGARVGL